jgi:hypothetical protein
MAQACGLQCQLRREPGGPLEYLLHELEIGVVSEGLFLRTPYLQSFLDLRLGALQPV